MSYAIAMYKILRVICISVLVFMLFSCTSELSVTKKLESLSQLAFKQGGLYVSKYEVDEEGFLIYFLSSKHVDIYESRRMMLALFYHVEDLGLSEQRKLISLSFEEEEGYISEVILRRDRLYFYVYDDMKKCSVMVYEEPLEGAFDRSFGKINPEMAPYIPYNTL